MFKSAGSCVANLRNSVLFRAIRALDLTHLNHNLRRSELIGGSVAKFVLRSDLFYFQQGAGEVFRVQE